MDPPNYTQIEVCLYMGGAGKSPPFRTDAVLNLCELDDPYRTPVYLWEPIADAAPAPDLDWLRRLVHFLDEQQQADRITYVHCRNGVSRSGFVIIAYEMHKNHWTRDQTLDFVRKKRPDVRPNPAFMERLLEWEREIRD
ncbi:MAG TPA: dual specificity protein phosphatase [Gemmataceae bacterium]